MSGPLAGIRIVMMGGLGPGPFCGMLLGGLGADVVRVDRVTEVDQPPPIDTVMRRSQRSIAVDMKHPRGRELVYALTADAHAFVDVYRPGAAERLGIGPDDLLERNPRLVYARMTGWGQDGPYAQMAGHDINYLALAGALHAIGEVEKPVPPLNLVGDYGGGGMLLAVGLLSAIIESRHSGVGQVVDVAMFEGAALLMTAFYGLFAEGRWEDRRGANVIDGAAHYYRTYETADGEHFAVGAMEPPFYAELCARLGVSVPQEDTTDAWAAHGATMAARFREKTRAEWEAELVTPQSCASPVLGLSEAPDHPHSRRRGTFVIVDGVVQPAPAPRFSRTPAIEPSPPSLPGDHTLAVLVELGLEGTELLQTGVARRARPAEERVVTIEQLGELGFYTLAGHTDSPRDLLDEAREAEALGLGAAFVSERFNLKDASTLCGAVAAVTEQLGVATAATNHNTRHPMVTATFATTMHRLSGGRFALGLGRGFDPLFRGMGLEPITSAQLEDAADILRRLWKGEMILGHDGPSGTYPYLHQDAGFDEDIPLMLVALGEKTIELAGRCMDGVVLHTFFGDEALTNSVAAMRRGAERAGRDPSTVRVWSVLATIGDHIDEAKRLKKSVGRLASYLQGYGDLLVRVNGWDPAALERFRADDFVQNFRGAFDAKATTSELEYLATLLPEEWTATAATGTPEQCATAVLHQFELGADSVILHGATPAELAPILPAYRAVRPEGTSTMPANPGRMP